MKPAAILTLSTWAMGVVLILVVLRFLAQVVAAVCG